MAVRKVVRIDEDLCNGCGECVPSCAEGAIQIINGKAKLVADNLCDGLGACLGDCPMNAITIEERDADEFDEAAVEKHMEKKAPPAITGHGHGHGHGGGGGGCPGSRMMSFDREPAADAAVSSGPQPSELRQWPVQMHLVSPMAPYFQNADVLLAADCVAFSLGDFHKSWLKGKALAIACPKLDDGQDIYLSKLVAMIDQAKINTLTVMIMEVPCCGGLAQLALRASQAAARKVPVKRIVVGLKGDIIAEDWL